MNRLGSQSLAKDSDMPTATGMACSAPKQCDARPSSAAPSCEPALTVSSRGVNRPLSPVTRSPSPQAKRLRRSAPPSGSSSPPTLTNVKTNSNSHHLSHNHSNKRNHTTNLHHDHIHPTSTNNNMPRSIGVPSPTSVADIPNTDTDTDNHTRNNSNATDNDRHGDLPTSSYRFSAQMRALNTLARRDVDHAKPLRGYIERTVCRGVITPNMREQLVGWSADLADDLHLPCAIAAITVNLFDRFISLRFVSTPVLHAVAAASFLVAFKLVSDDDPPLRLIARRARVTVSCMLSVETALLNVLQWHVSIVTPHEVVAQLTQAAKIDNCCSARYEPRDQSNKRPVPNHENMDMSPQASSAGVHGVDVAFGNGNDECQRCVDDTSGSGPAEEERLLSYAMHDALLMHALMDYRTASMRATSVGVACLLVAEAARKGLPIGDVDTLQYSPLYSIAKKCGVSMAEVDLCADYLLAVVATLFEDVEDADSDQSE